MKKNFVMDEKEFCHGRCGPPYSSTEVSSFFSTANYNDKPSRSIDKLIKFWKNVYYYPSMYFVAANVCLQFYNPIGVN